MVRAAVGRSVCLMHYCRISLNLKPTVPGRTGTKLAELFSPASPFFIISTCFSSKVRIADSGKFNLGGKDESHSALTDFLKCYEFSEADIDKIIRRFPQILSCRISTSLKPKLDYLVECGFHGSALHRVVATDPILHRSLYKHIKPRYQFLKAFLMEKVNLVIMRNSRILYLRDVELNVEYLKEQGVLAERITKLLACTSNVVGLSKNRMAELVESTKALGVEPADTMFIWYIRMFGSMSKTSWKKKLEVFKSLGWSEQDIRATLLQYPFCFQISEEKLRGNMDFYINTVKTERKAIIAIPYLLMYSLNGRIVPRYEVLKLSKEHNLLKSWRASTFFIQPEKRFIKMYIEKNIGQVPHLLRLYSDCKKAKPDTARLHS